jgi:hypothetical protein
MPVHDQRPDNESPPFLGSWTALYILVLAALGLMILFSALMTELFS